MNQNRNVDNDVNGTGTSGEGASSGRCPVDEQRRPGRNQETAKMKWTKEMNIVVMECFYSADPFDENGVPIRGYRQRMYREWRERGMFNTSEQRLCDQARAIRKNGWLSEVELEAIRRRLVKQSEEEHQQDEEDILSRSNIEEVNEADITIEVSEAAEITPEEQLIIDEVKGLMAQGVTNDNIMFKKVDQKRLSEETLKVNGAIKHLVTADITQTNNLIKAASLWVAKQLGLKTVKKEKKQDPWWKRRIEGDIKNLKKDISILEREKREELKQRLLAKAAKIKRYGDRITQYRQNRMFVTEQKKVYKELNGGASGESVIPDAEESKKFWSEIWSIEKEHNRQAEWLQDLKGEQSNVNMGDMEITVEMVKTQSRKIPNWKAPGRDGVQGYWIKQLSSLHERIANQLNEIISGANRLPEWMVYGRTVLCQKDPAKGRAVDNFRPISCLPLMWKLLTGMIAEEMYGFLEREKILPDEQKGCRKGSRGTKDQLLIDKTVLKDCKRRKTNLAMAWIDYKKAYDMVPHSWIIECLELFGIAENVRKFMSDSMRSWKLELTSSGESLGDVHIHRGIFQGDSLSPLLFVLCMIPLTLILRKVAASYEWGNKEFRINHLLFMDDLKLFAKNQDQIDSLVQTVHLFSEDIGMQFGLNKCGVLVLKRGKMVKQNGVALPNGQMMKEIDESGYKYLGIVEMDKIKETDMKEKFTSEYKRRLKLVLKSKLNGKNKILAINTWAVSVLRYGAGILKWTVDELKNMDRKSRKIMTMHGAVHPKSDADRLYLTREKGGRGLISCEGCVRTQEQALRTNYVKHHIDKSAESPLCRMCEEKGETVHHIVSECKKMAQKEYKRRHDNVARIVHWHLCKKYNLERTEKWYEHAPEGVVENDEVKLLWDVNIQCDHLIEARRPDIVVGPLVKGFDPLPWDGKFGY
ncbi:uncharacterized protein LOC134772704 [Penaeus indicus]|uniref:uncharacterized protein LOC134772704 n=1 Tax=Penaeus indicus TaxID=29960 RepID=UPI00300D0038